jgi:hypothetical protein
MRRQRFWTEWWQALPDFSLLLISFWIKFWFVTVVPKYLNCATFSKDLLPIFMSWSMVIKPNKNVNQCYSTSLSSNMSYYCKLQLSLDESERKEENLYIQKISWSTVTSSLIKLLSAGRVMTIISNAYKWWPHTEAVTVNVLLPWAYTQDTSFNG